jgi:hypothetical protein
MQQRAKTPPRCTPQTRRKKSTPQAGHFAPLLAPGFGHPQTPSRGPFRLPPPAGLISAIIDKSTSTPARRCPQKGPRSPVIGGQGAGGYLGSSRPPKRACRASTGRSTIRPLLYPPAKPPRTGPEGLFTAPGEQIRTPGQVRGRPPSGAALGALAMGPVWTPVFGRHLRRQNRAQIRRGFWGHGRGLLGVNPEHL